MAIKLVKTINRETFTTDHRGNVYIVSLSAGDMISFRLKGKRKTVSMYLGHALRLAQMLQWDMDYDERMRSYVARKKAGFKGLKKPKRMQPPFAKVYFDAFNAAKQMNK